MGFTVQDIIEMDEIHSDLSPTLKTYEITHRCRDLGPYSHIVLKYALFRIPASGLFMQHVAGDLMAAIYPFKGGEIISKYSYYGGLVNLKYVDRPAVFDGYDLDGLGGLTNEEWKMLLLEYKP